MSSDIFGENSYEPSKPIKELGIFWLIKCKWITDGEVLTIITAVQQITHDGAEDSRDRSWTINLHYEGCVRGLSWNNIRFWTCPSSGPVIVTDPTE
jgi:hypothetical protein